MAGNRAAFETPTTPDTGYLAPYCAARGDAVSSLFNPEGFTLWKLGAELADGTELVWEPEHGDEVVFVVEGEVQVDGRTCRDEGVVIVEADATPAFRAVGDVRLLHFGPVEKRLPTDGLFGPAESPGRGVQVITAEESPEYHTIVTTFFSDGSEPTRRLAFFTVDLRDSAEGMTVDSHKHSEDEIIHVLDGTMQVGPTTVPAGLSMAVPAELRYGFKTDGPLRFLNYRRDASTMVTTPGSAAEPETRARLLERLHSGEFGTRYDS